MVLVTQIICNWLLILHCTYIFINFYYNLNICIFLQVWPSCYTVHQLFTTFWLHCKFGQSIWDPKAKHSCSCILWFAYSQRGQNTLPWHSSCSNKACSWACRRNRRIQEGEYFPILYMKTAVINEKYDNFFRELYLSIVFFWWMCCLLCRCE